MTYPTVLLVDDNHNLLDFLARIMAHLGCKVLTSKSATEAKLLVDEHKPDAAVLDFMLPDGSGVELGMELLQAAPQMVVLITTGTILPPEEEALCEEHNVPVMRKPFLASELMDKIQRRMQARLVIGAEAPRGSINIEAVQGKALKVFVSYSHRDEVWQKRLDSHLSTLKRMGIIHSWHDRQIISGTDFSAAIDKYLNLADLILLLISPDFIASDYCYHNEMTQALERQRRQETHVIPVIVRPVDWEKAPFSHLQAVPRDGKAITLWANKDQALMDAARSIRRAAEALSASIRRR